MGTELFNQFENLLMQRIKHTGALTNFGEDSIRYDFFMSLIKTYNLKPFEIYLEQAIPSSQFIDKQNNNERKQGRQNYKPEVDLIVYPTESVSSGFVCEFSFFRKTKISKNQDKTGRHGKLLNDIYRLSLMKHHEKFKSFKHYLICVTDEEMINYGKENTRGPVPILISDNYSLCDNFLNSLKQTAKAKIDDKFYLKTKYLGITPTAKRILNKQFDTPSKWAIWVWEINIEMHKLN